MTRTLFRSLAFLLLAGTALARTHEPVPTPTPDHHERKPDEVFRLRPLRGDVYALYGRGGNVGFFVGPDAVVVVDSEFKDIAPGIVAQIRTVSDRPIKYLVNTHHHGDHVGGNEVFKPFAVIIAQDNVRKRMLESPQVILRPRLPAYRAHIFHALRHSCVHPIPDVFRVIETSMIGGRPLQLKKAIGGGGHFSSRVKG